MEMDVELDGAAEALNRRDGVIARVVGGTWSHAKISRGRTSSRALPTVPRW